MDMRAFIRRDDGSDGGAFTGAPHTYAARRCDYREMTVADGLASLPMTAYADAQHAQVVSKGVMTFAADETGWTPVGCGRMGRSKKWRLFL